MKSLYAKHKSLLHAAIAPLAVVALVLGGCGQQPRLSGTVAAEVNQQIITVREVEQSATNSDGATLERLIDQQLLAQEAERLKLGSNPAVLADLDAARTSVLATSYIDHALAQSAAPTTQDIRDYYRQHPELFAHRRLYLLHELHLALPADRFAELRRRADSAHDLEQVERWLQAAQISYEASDSARTTDELPRAVLPAFLHLKDGDIGVARTPEGAWVLQVIASVPRPLSEAQAEPSIAKYLQQRLRDAVARAEVQRLRDQAQIQYHGPFAAPIAPDASLHTAAVRPAAAPRLDAASLR